MKVAPYAVSAKGVRLIQSYAEIVDAVLCGGEE